MEARAQQKANLVLLDADDCLYNYRYRHYLRKFIKCYYEYFPQTDKSYCEAEIKEKIPIIMKAVFSEEEIEDDANLYDIEKQADAFNEMFVYIENLGLAKEVFDPILLKANEELLEEIIDQAKDAEKVHLGLASNRQSYWRDQWGMEKFGTRSIFTDLIVIRDYLRKKLPDKNILLFEATTADAYSNQGLGSAYQQILQHVFQENTCMDLDSLVELLKQPKQFAKALYDHSKFTILYLIVHALMAEEYKNCSVDLQVYVYDDLFQGILTRLHNILEQFPSLLPSCTLFFSYYAGRFNDSSLLCVKTNGEVDYNYARNMVKLAKKYVDDATYYDEKKVDFDSKSFDAIGEREIIDEFLKERRVYGPWRARRGISFFDGEVRTPTRPQPDSETPSYQP